MEYIIEKLEKRYGKRFDYNLTTEVQRSFLSSPDIQDNTDSGGFKTVGIESITLEIIIQKK